MNIATIVSTLNIDISHIVKIKIQHFQAMATITNGHLKFKRMIKTNNGFPSLKSTLL